MELFCPVSHRIVAVKIAMLIQRWFSVDTMQDVCVGYLPDFSTTLHLCSKHLRSSTSSKSLFPPPAQASYAAPWRVPHTNISAISPFAGTPSNTSIYFGNGVESSYSYDVSFLATFCGGLCRFISARPALPMNAMHSAF